MKIDPAIIERFRDTINRGDGLNAFLFKKYPIDAEKNQYALIAACLDSITSAVRYLRDIDIENDHNREKDYYWMQVYSYITAIDIVFESITQLYRVFIPPSDPLPFADETTRKIFVRPASENDCKKHLDFTNDNRYFKRIRAIFGAHPVDLNAFDQNGKKIKTEKWYASYPPRCFGDYGADLSVPLWSNDQKASTIYFGIFFDELDAFCNERYQYLNQLKNTLEKQYEEYLENYRKQPIQWPTDVKERLEILENESQKRLNMDLHREIISELKSIFSVDLDEPELQDELIEFRKELEPLIDELKDHLQRMDFHTDLKWKILLDPDIIMPEKTDGLIKRYVEDIWWRHPNRPDDLRDAYREIDKCLKGKYLLSQEKNPDKLRLKTKLLLRTLQKTPDLLLNYHRDNKSHWII